VQGIAPDEGEGDHRTEQLRHTASGQCGAQTSRPILSAPSPHEFRAGNRYVCTYCREQIDK
jgi:hypothetical protein